MVTKWKGFDYMEKYSTEKEVWKDIEGYEGRYQVSDCGRVKSVSRNYTAKNGMKRFHKGMILKPVNDYYGYHKVSLRCEKQILKVPKIHRLVAETFLPNPENKSQVNHLNGIKTDNRLSNLEWCTPKENTQHAEETGLRDYKGKRNPTSILNEEKVKEIRKLYSSGKYYQKELGKMFGVTRSTISDIIIRATWKHVK